MDAPEVADEDVEDADEESIVKLYSPKAEGRGPALALSTTVTIGGREAVDDEVIAEEEEEEGAGPVVCPAFCSCSSACIKPLAYCSCSSVTFLGKRN